MRKRIPKTLRLALVLALACNMAAYYGTRLFTAQRLHFDLTCVWDDRIPLIPWTIAIYWGCYVFWVVGYLLGCRQNEDEAWRFISADLAAKLVCMFCFLVFPTIKERPAIDGCGLWERALALLYRMDAPDQLFPSIHCLTSWFCFIAVRKNADIWLPYRCLTLLFALCVCVSTLTTKQHVLADAAAAIALAEGSYLFVEKSGFARRYQKALSRWGAEKTREGRRE